MTIPAQTVIQEIQLLLQDPLGTRWPAWELVQHLNDGQREIATMRPDMMAKTLSYPLAAGARQTTPSDCVKLVELTRNTDGAAIRQVERNTIDAVEPNWYQRATTNAIKNFTYDLRDPGTFYVYPPARGGTSVELVYSTAPVDIAPATGDTSASVSGNIGVNDVFKNALIHFALFRAVLKDAEYAANASLAASHYQMFKAAVTDEFAARQAVRPTITDTPVTTG